jgi:hypothetical protein
MMYVQLQQCIDPASASDFDSNALKLCLLVFLYIKYALIGMGNHSTHQ